MLADGPSGCQWLNSNGLQPVSTLVQTTELLFSVTLLGHFCLEVSTFAPGFPFGAPKAMGMAHGTDWGLVFLNLASVIRSVSQTCAVCASFFFSAKWVEELLLHLAVVGLRGT